MVGPLVPALLLALYAGFAPVAALVCIVLLEAPHPLRRSAAYVAGYVVALVVIATAGAALFDQWAGPGLSAGLAGFHRDRGAPSAGRQVVSVGIGVALLVLAAVRWRRRGARLPAPAAPAWLRAAERVRPLRAFGLGVLVFVGNVDNVLIYLAAVYVVGDAGLGDAAAVLATALVVATAAAPVLIPLAVYVARPAAAAARLGALKAWIGRASQTALTALLAVAGGWMVGRELAGFLE